MALTEMNDYMNNAYNDDFFTNLIKKYSNAVYGTAYHMVGSFDLAQDIAQETFIKAYLNLDKLKNPEKAGSWLYSIVRHICIDYLRKNRQDDIELDENIRIDSETLEDKIETNEIKDRLKAALNKLTENNRLTTILCYIDGYTTKEVSSYLGISVEAVESRLKRARKQLKKEMLDMVENELKDNKLGEDFDKKIEGILREIQKLQAVGKQKEALAEIEKYLKKYSQSELLKSEYAHILTTVGSIEDNMELLKKAEKEYLNLLKDKPPLPDINVNSWVNCLAYNYMRMKNYDKAMEYFDKLGTEGSLGKVYVMRDQGKYDEALKLTQIYMGGQLQKLSISLMNLTNISMKADKRDMAYLYCKLNIDILEATGREYLILNDLWNTYVDLAKLLLDDGLIDECIESLKKAQEVAYLKCHSDFNDSKLFNLCKNDFIEGQNVEGTQLEWFLYYIQNKPFDKLKGNEEYENLIKDTQDKINENKK